MAFNNNEYMTLVLSRTHIFSIICCWQTFKYAVGRSCLDALKAHIMHCQLKLNMNGLEERRERGHVMCLFNIKYILYENPIRFEIIMIIIEEDTRDALRYL